MSEKFTLTKHNGRSGQNGVYNPKHNDRSFNISGSEHIDPERMKQNIYWDWIRGYSGWEDHNSEEDVLDLRFENVEKQFYNYPKFTGIFYNYIPSYVGDGIESETIQDPFRRTKLIG